MTNLSAIGIGVFSGIIFMIKVGALYFFTEYLRDKAKEKLDNNKSTTQIWASSFFYCLALSFVLSASKKILLIVNTEDFTFKYYFDVFVIFSLIKQ